MQSLSDSNCWRNRIELGNTRAYAKKLMEAIRYEIIDRADTLRSALACLKGRRCLALDL